MLFRSKMTVDVQFQHLRQCLKPEMQLWLKAVLAKKPNMPVLGDDGALVAIKKHFEEKYSLLRRRFDYWSYDRKDNQTMQDYMTRLRTLGLEAELDKVKPDDIEILRLIVGCNNSKVREELFRLDEKSDVNAYYARAALLERARFEDKHFSSKDVKINAISSYQAEKKKSHQEKVVKDNTVVCLNCDKEGHSHTTCYKTLDYEKVYHAEHPERRQSARGGGRGGNSSRGSRGNRGGGVQQGDTRSTNRIVVL